MQVYQRGMGRQANGGIDRPPDNQIEIIADQIALMPDHLR
jgi:hypothetical protein